MQSVDIILFLHNKKIFLKNVSSMIVFSFLLIRKSSTSDDFTKKLSPFSYKEKMTRVLPTDD